MTPPLLAFLALLPFAALPLLAAAALGARLPRPKPTARGLLVLAVVIYATLHAYVRSDEKPGPGPEPPEPPPGPYIPGGTWHTLLHRDPFSGSLEWRREYRLPPSTPEAPVEHQ